MLLLAHRVMPGEIEAATVDHGLRAESASEAAMVADLCAQLGVRHSTLVVTVQSGNLQDRAREARYAAMSDWLDVRDLAGLATAHHLDDQAETLLMRLNRGSGLSGLASIREIGPVPGGRYRMIRPLLDWRHGELVGIARDAGVAVADDPSNDDNRFDRVRIRKALADADWLDPHGLARSARLLSDADDALQFMIGREVVECVEFGEQQTVYHALRTGLGGLNIVRIGVVQSIFRYFGTTIDRSAAARLCAGLIAGRGGNVAGIHAATRDVGSERQWVFARENPRI